ncbi:protein FAM92A isoform X1 [Chrysoperla carnea]|uniref:protein FAM92A isoform X1 n=1 Tax=Chrysoperla carnea TaxID=189513 RepID=UPI001D067D87|nr:protein FAM92A isoform X1 [Chrysoperla carnea]
MDSFRSVISLKMSNNFSEQQAKFIQERITNVEKYFAELCTAFAAYIRKAARIRDKTDELATVIQTYSNSESVNKTLREALTNFSTILLSLGDFKDARVQKLDNKVVAELSQYEVICKHAKDEVKHTFVLREKEINRKKQLDKIRERNPRNRQQINQAETELVKASAEVSRTIKALEDQTDEFERQKLRNLKTILLDFITIELAYHAKSIELFTKAYQSIDNIDEQADVEDFQTWRKELHSEFRTIIRMPERISRFETVRRMSFGKHSLSLPALELEHNNLKQPTIKNNKPVSKSMESMDSFKVSVDDTNEDSFTTTNDSTSIPVPAPRRII